MKIHIKKGDEVQVMAGEAKGAKGRVVNVDRTNYRAMVEGVNLVSRHVKPSASNPEGGITKQEAPIHISNLMLIDPKSSKPGRVGLKKDSDGKTVRYFKNSGEELK